MVTNVSIYLPVIYYLFPNVQHLTLNSLTPNEVDTARCLLPLFSRHSSLTIKDLNFDRIQLSVSVCGDRIRRLNFFGKSSSVDIVMLNVTCPNLETLSVTHSQLVMGDDFIEPSKKKRFIEMF
jgi:hypothetical protein